MQNLFACSSYTIHIIIHIRIIYKSLNYELLVYLSFFYVMYVYIIFMFGFDMKNLQLLADIIGHNWIETAIFPVGIRSPRKNMTTNAPTWHLQAGWRCSLGRHWSKSPRAWCWRGLAAKVFSVHKKGETRAYPPDHFHQSSISVFKSCTCTLCREECSRPEHAHDQTCLAHWQDRLEDFTSMWQRGTWKTMLYREQLIPWSYRCSLTKKNQGNDLS